MAYSARMQKNHLYSTFFAPRGNDRMADLGMQIAAQYLSPFDKLIGLIGDAGSGKSMIIKGMFPGMELTNDDEGVNVRPLPILDIDDSGFYSAHTYHLDVRFESGFKQMHELAEAILYAISKGKRVVVEHFDLVYPFLGRNAHLLIGVGEEIIVTRPTLFGPKPQDISDIVFKSIHIRLMIHTAEDICEHFLELAGIGFNMYEHSDVRHGFILSFERKPDIDLQKLEEDVNEVIRQDLPVAYRDERHVAIGDVLCICTGPRMHVRSTGMIKKLHIHQELLQEPITNNYLLVGMVGENVQDNISELNKITMQA